VGSPISEFEALVQAGTPLSRAQAEVVLASPDLIGIGLLGEMARRATSGDRVTYGRVCEIAAPAMPADPGEAGEVRVTGTPASIGEARAWVREAVRIAGGRPVTAFSLTDLTTLAGGDRAALADLARALHDTGLEGVAEARLDVLGDADRATALVRAAVDGGLAVRRATVTTAPAERRLDLIERAARIQKATGAFRAFAPLPRVDPADSPATGYDDVRTIAVARLMCRAIPFIQVDWNLYGPKLAQVAIAYGANDLDGVAAIDPPGVGPRRSSREDVERQIRAAFAAPVERDARYEALG
jgi:aminodeoxyfutalosine synthase